jgi:hypothetical protein
MTESKQPRDEDDSRQEEPRERDDRDPISLFAPHLREEFEILRRSEDKILRGLEDPRAAERFATDPARALAEIGVDVPPLMKGRLVGERRPEPIPSERRFRLPNGQVVTARVKVHFTGGRER